MTCLVPTHRQHRTLVLEHGLALCLPICCDFIDSNLRDRFQSCASRGVQCGAPGCSSYRQLGSLQLDRIRGMKLNHLAGQRPRCPAR